MILTARRCSAFRLCHAYHSYIQWCCDLPVLLCQLKVLKRLNNAASTPLCGLQGTAQNLKALAC